MANILNIGQKNYSSWSLRAWLVLRWAGIAFNENLIPLDQPGYGSASIRQVLDASPNGQVPSLHVEEHVIWDTLAIAEWAYEHCPQLWPEDKWRRAHARSITAEMHASFFAVRRDLPMNIMRRCPEQDWAADTRRGMARFRAIITECRAAYAADGPWLFGQRSIADAFYTPMATRFRTYAVPLDDICQAYADTAFNDSHFLEWQGDCFTDSWDQSGFSVIDGLYRS